jgi:hypothetical protein
VKFTVKEVQKTAQTHIEEPGVTAGTPELVDNTYVVPVMSEGKKVGFIVIDADTGKVIDGGGDAIG